LSNVYKQLESEINLHRNLNHLHVVRFYCHFQYEGNIIIILEHCPNKVRNHFFLSATRKVLIGLKNYFSYLQSLMQLMHHRTTLTEPEVLFYLRQLIFGLRYIHANNIVHQDLKLANILLSESMTVKICDFGLAARFHSESEV
jgi:serine/threonine protein kinase